jgi:hypothetical protein
MHDHNERMPMSTTGNPFPFEGCRARVDELLDARADMEVVEQAIDACGLDRDEKDALWLWASGRRQRLTRQPPLLATSQGEPDDEAW